MPAEFRPGDALLAALASALDLDRPVLAMTLEIQADSPPLVGVTFHATAEQTDRLTAAVAAHDAHTREARPCLES